MLSFIFNVSIHFKTPYIYDNGMKATLLPMWVREFVYYDVNWCGVLIRKSLKQIDLDFGIWLLEFYWHCLIKHLLLLTVHYKTVGKEVRRVEKGPVVSDHRKQCCSICCVLYFHRCCLGYDAVQVLWQTTNSIIFNYVVRTWLKYDYAPHGFIYLS